MSKTSNTEPTTTELLERGMERHRVGRLAEAEQLYLQVLTREPRHADALYLMGTLAMQAERLDVARDLLVQAVTVDPDNAVFYANLGEVQRRLGQAEDAIAALARSISLEPSLAEPHYNLGLLLMEVGQIESAADCFARALEAKPEMGLAHYYLAGAKRMLGDLDEAIVHYEQAIASNPRFVEALVDLAGTLRMKRRLDDAIALYQKACKANPNFALAHNNLGVALMDRGRVDEALASARRALSIDPNLTDAHNNVGHILKQMGLVDDAVHAFRNALAQNPDHVAARSNLVYTLSFHPASDSSAILAEARIWNERHAEPRRNRDRAHASDRAPERRLRIGYVSPDFREHCQALFMLPLFAHHDRKSFEIVCYSSVQSPDHMTERLRAHADAWRDIGRLTDAAAADVVREDGVDVLVDLTMHMANHRLALFAHEPAPVQVSWLAYPGTTGLSAIHYRITDRFLDPPEMDDAIYAEKSVRLPDTFWCYDPLATGPEVSELPALANRYVTFGQLNNFSKASDAALDAWTRVLLAVEGSRLVLQAPEGRARQRVREAFERAGVARDRIAFVGFMPRAEYLATYRDIDICLDSFPYNGHTTSLDAFWMGVPVVTLVGSTVVGRAGLCQAMNLDLPELIAQDADEFVRIAFALAKDLTRLRSLRADLRARMERSPLMDAPRFARNIEAAYRTMWRAWCDS